MTPPLIESRDAEREALLTIAKLILASVRTAPKSGGIDDILALIVNGKKKDSIAETMELIGKERKSEGFVRDAKNIRESETVVLVGVRGSKSFGLNCGACGHRTCESFEKVRKKEGEDYLGPTCLFKALDLGIALGSAVKTASLLDTDNRIMYRVGAAAKRLNIIPEATIVIGIPLSASGKSIFFDRAR